MATIYDVARLAGVSPKTVSRVMNGEGPVSELTRSSVEDAMITLGYVPSSAARSIKSQKSGLIGLITGAISSPDAVGCISGLPELIIVQGAQHAFEQARRTLLISDTGGRLDRVPGLVRTFRAHRVEGLLYVSDFHQRLDPPLPVDGVPTVLVNCYDDAGTPAVLPDDAAGQRDLTRRVIASGHRRIAYLSLGPSRDATRLRLQGLRAALAEAGIPFDPKLVASADLPGRPGEHQLAWDALERFLLLSDPPTAICCGNDRLAMVAYGILRERGISIPEDVSVTGFDDHKVISETLRPPLTTAALPYSAMGARAAELLLELMGKPEIERRRAPLLVRGQTRERGSLRAARHGPAKIIELKGRTKT